MAKTAKIKKIVSFEEACTKNGTDPKDPKFSTGTPDDIAYQKLKEITKAINPADFKVDYNNGSQQKWYPYFTGSGSGFRFIGSGYGWTSTLTSGGARLSFATEEDSNHAAKTFLSLYKDFLT